MLKPATGVPAILVLMAIAAAVPPALANEEAPAASAAEDMPASQKGGTTAEPLATEANAAGAPAPGTIDPIVPPVKRVMPVTPSLKALKPAAKKPAETAKKPATPAVKVTPSATGQPTKAADNGKPGETKPDETKKK